MSAQPIEAFRNAFKIPELKQRIIFTLFALMAYRLGAHVPTPGVDGHALRERIGDMGGLLNFYNMFSGGAFAQATIFALGIMPYITASIVMSLLVVVIPQLEALQKEALRQYAVAKGYSADIFDKPSLYDIDPNAMMSRYMSGLTLSMVRQTPTMTKVKLRFDNVYYPGLVDQYYAVVWRAVDKQMFLDKGLD